MPVLLRIVKEDVGEAYLIFLSFHDGRNDKVLKAVVVEVSGLDDCLAKQVLLIVWLYGKA